MSLPILQTKLFIPRSRPTLVRRSTLLALFLHLWIIFMLFNVVDLLLIDWLIVEFIRPAFIVPG